MDSGCSLTAQAGVGLRKVAFRLGEIGVAAGLCGKSELVDGTHLKLLYIPHRYRHLFRRNRYACYLFALEHDERAITLFACGKFHAISLFSTDRNQCFAPPLW